MSRRRPPAALLAYGSLMHPEELADHPVRPRAAAPVRVAGFRRGFQQEPAWRGGVGLERAVLTVRASPGDTFNGVLLSGIDPAALPALDERERGYVRTPVARDRLAAYGGSELPLEGGAEVYLYAGRPERYDERLLPGAAYLALCLAAAAHWGEAFRADFLATTFVGAGVPLGQHLRVMGDAPRP